MDEETRKDIDGIGGRITEFKEEFVAYRATSENEIGHLKEEHAEATADIKDIKLSLDTLTKQMTGITVKLSLLVAAIVIVIQLVAPLLLGHIR